ncbi:MAG: hypothetical protein JXA10_18020 [Anaerolineae bacterium]|nr:hypothetical protein [Anaerolineae bacterium]
MMVKLQDSKGKSGESFERIFGNQRMGALFSKLQSAVIRSGFELEKMIEEAVPDSLITTLDELEEISEDIRHKPPIQIVVKPARPDPDNTRKSIEADLLVVDNRERLFKLVEIKDGYVFDTKKADGELASLKNITSWLAQEFAYRAQYFLCAFNQDDKEIIVAGTKKRFSIDHVLTGHELCDMIGIDYDALCERREHNQSANRRYFLSELLAIPEIRSEIIELLDTLNA